MSEAVSGWKVMAGMTQLGGLYTNQSEAVKDADAFNSRASQLKAEDGVHRDIAYVIPTTLFKD